MKKRKVKTYLNTLMADRGFKEKFEKEYQKLAISEQLAQLRKNAHLTQSALAKRIHTTKSAISRYESAAYDRYSIFLLKKIACACNSDLKVMFLPVRIKRKALQTSQK